MIRRRDYHGVDRFIGQNLAIVFVDFRPSFGAGHGALNAPGVCIAHSHDLGIGQRHDGLHQLLGPGAHPDHSDRYPVIGGHGSNRIRGRGIQFLQSHSNGGSSQRAPVNELPAVDSILSDMGKSKSCRRLVTLESRNYPELTKISIGSEKRPNRV